MIKKIIIVVICCLSILIVVSIFWNDFIRIFKQSIQINYNQEIAFITIGFSGRLASDDEQFTEIKIENKSDIEKIINYLNSLKLIEEFPKVKYFPDPYDSETIYITVFKSRYKEDANEFDVFVFQKKYMSFTPNGSDWKSKTYYVEDSGYNLTTKNSKIYKFLYDYMNK